MGKESRDRIAVIDTYNGYFECRDKLDTVVFVHGLCGNFIDTWKKFPTLLTDDPDLPSIDILLTGYKSSIFRPLVHDTKTIGRQFLTTVREQVEPGNMIFLVGHSMGGLIVLEGLVQEMKKMRAEEFPCSEVEFISLVATPVTGSNAAALVTHTLGKLKYWSMAVNKHIRSLSAGKEINGLINEVNERIYRPLNNHASAKKIPIRRILGSSDVVVASSDTDASVAIFSDGQGASELDFGHSSIKEPQSLLDTRYKTLANDIKSELAIRLQTLCKLVVDPEQTRDARHDAFTEFKFKYESLFDKRFVAANFCTTKDRKLYFDYIKNIVLDSARTGRPAHDIASRTLMTIERHRVTP